MLDDATVEELEWNTSDLDLERNEIEERHLGLPSLNNQHSIIEGPQTSTQNQFEGFFIWEDELKIPSLHNATVNTSGLAPDSRHRSDD